MIACLRKRPVIDESLGREVKVLAGMAWHGMAESERTNQPTHHAVSQLALTADYFSFFAM